MLYKNLSSKELYASIPDAKIIAKMFETGLEIGSSQLAVSAMEELMFRGNTDIIATKLQSAFDKGQLQLGNSLTSMIARSLVEHREDPVLNRFGKTLLRGQGSEGPLKWFHTPGAKSLFGGEELPKQQETESQKPEKWPNEVITEAFQPQGF